jgi:hypothetical protein
MHRYHCFATLLICATVAGNGKPTTAKAGAAFRATTGSRFQPVTAI